MREIPRKVSGLYTRSLHRDHEGEWDFDLAWKPVESWPVYAGWLRAIRRGHAQLHRGLDVPCPVLVLSSGGSAAPAEMGDDVHRHDIVLDVAQIRRWAPAIGRHVTIVAVAGRPARRGAVAPGGPEGRLRRDGPLGVGVRGLTAHLQHVLARVAAMNSALGLAAARVADRRASPSPRPSSAPSCSASTRPANPQLPYMARLFGSREIVARRRDPAGARARPGAT